MLNFLHRHLLALGITAGAALGVGCSAAHLSDRATYALGICLAAVICVPAWMLDGKRNSRKLRTNGRSGPPVPYESPYTVTFDDEEVTVIFSGHRREAVRWADLVMIVINIEDGYFPLPFWVLFGMPGKGGCVYPNDAVGAGEMLRELQRRLPGFDNHAVGAVMIMLSGSLCVWRRPDWKV